MATITALNVRLGMDASNFSAGADLARSEVNRVAATMRQSVPPAEKYKREIDLLNRAFSDSGRQTKEYANAVEFLSKKHSQGAHAADLAARSNSNLLSGVRGIAAAYISFQGIKAGITIASDMEQATIAFEVLTGSVEKGQKTLADLRSFAASTPVSLPGALQAAKTMLGYNISVEKVMPTLRMLGDISGGNEEKFKSLAKAFSDTSAAGRLMGQELLQFINAGFNPLQEISRTTGIGMTELKKRMEAGGISADMVSAAFASATGPTGRFFGMMDRMSKTAAGSYAQLVSAIQEMVAQVGSHLLPILASAAKSMEQVVRSTSGLVSSFSRSQVQILAMVGGFVATVLVIPKVIAMVKALILSLQLMTKVQQVALAFGGPKGWAILAAGAVVAAVAVNEVNKAFDAMEVSSQAAMETSGAAVASAGKATTAAVAAIGHKLTPIETQFKTMEQSLNAQVRLANLGEDTFRRQENIAKGMSARQVQRIESLHQELKLAEKRNEKDKEQSEAKKQAIEENKRQVEESEKAFAEEIAKSIESAKQFFVQEREANIARRKDVSAGPGAGMEAGSAEAVKFMADQVNASIGAAAVPELPTPGEKQIVEKSKELLIAQRESNLKQAQQLETTKQLLAAFKENKFTRIR